MRPGNRWNGESTSPLAAALYCALVALGGGYLLSLLLGRVGIWVIHGRGAMFSPQYLMRSALNLYAGQHVPLIGSGMVRTELGPIAVHADLTLPLTFFALVPSLALLLGGYIAARSRLASGRWGMIGPALAGGVIYAIVLAAAARFIHAQFTSVALPEFTTSTMSTQFNPPRVPFHPSIAGALGYSLIFALLSTYLGALIAVKSSSEAKIAGKWWACARAVVLTGLVIQLLVACAGLVAAFHGDLVADDARAKFAAMLPTAAGIGYALVYDANLAYGGGTPAVQATYYDTKLGIYRGITTTSQGKTEHKPLSPYVFIAGLIGALMVLASGRLAVKWGSRDGSLPTAVRITILQAGYLALQMLLCGMSLGAESFKGFLQPQYHGSMLLACLGIFVLALAGAYWANQRYLGRLGGFPTA